MNSHPRTYTAVVFLAGILLTLGLKDFYPDLERRFHRRQKTHVSSIAAAGLDDTDKVELSDGTESNDRHVDKGKIHIPEGIQACIGNTPLFRIKSLSEETGCEILAKAEV